MAPSAVKKASTVRRTGGGPLGLASSDALQLHLLQATLTVSIYATRGSCSLNRRAARRRSISSNRLTAESLDRKSHTSLGSLGAGSGGVLAVRLASNAASSVTSTPIPAPHHVQSTRYPTAAQPQGCRRSTKISTAAAMAAQYNAYVSAVKAQPRDPGAAPGLRALRRLPVRGRLVCRRKREAT